MLSSDFPSGTLNKKKTLREIEWNSTCYPNNTGETVELCYHRPYTTVPVGCIKINPNSSGRTNAFNNQPFGLGTDVFIRHHIQGGQFPGAPAGKDSVTFYYSY